MIIETAHKESDGIGGYTSVWLPSAYVMGTFCCIPTGYHFIYKCSREISAQDRFRLGNRKFEIMGIAAAGKERWQIATLKECHDG